MLDVNKGLVVTPGVTSHEFSNWSVDLQAQVSGATVSTYSWNVSQASDATSVTGQSTYELKFTWANFTGAARTDQVTITATNSDSTQESETLTFQVNSTSSPAYPSSAPTSSATWPNVLAPDQLISQTTVNDGYYELGLANGALQTSHQLPSYNPNVSPLNLVYSSTAADRNQIFIAHYPLVPTGSNTGVPATVHATLTFNGTAGQTYYYSTSSLNPGDMMEIALEASVPSSLAAGEYNYEIDIVADYSTPQTTTWTGAINISASSGMFGPGWSLAGLTQIRAPNGYAVVDEGAGQDLLFAPQNHPAEFIQYNRPNGDFTDLVQSEETLDYLRTFPDGTNVNYTSGGVQTSVVDPQGNPTTYTYNGQNQLISITDIDNQVVTFNYNGAGQVVTIVNPANRVTTFGYTGSNLTSIQDPDGALWTYAYDSSSHLTTLTDAPMSSPRSPTTSPGASRASLGPTAAASS